MAIAVKYKRTTTTNTFVVTGGSGDTGKLQIQYNDSDIYNNLSGASSDILSGASNSTINIPLDDDGNIPQGVYYFNFVASVGSSATLTNQFLISHIEPSIDIEVDVYSPELETSDNTSYSIENGSATSVSRILTLTYPTGSNQTALTASAAASATTVSITTSNVWTGANQVTLDYDITYTITPVSTLYSSFTYQEVGVGYESEVIETDNALCTLYCCIDGLRKKVKSSASTNRANYPTLLSDYTYACSLALQYREAITCGKTAALDDIYAQIQNVTQCNGCDDCEDSTSTAPQKIYGIGNSTDTEAVQEIVGTMFDNGTNYGITVEYDDTLKTVNHENWGLYLKVYNSGASIAAGKAVHVAAYNSAQGLIEVGLATNVSANSAAQALGLTTTSIASGASGRCLVSGTWTGDTSSYSVGDRLYLSTAGGLTATIPTGTNQYQFIGTVTRANASLGTIQVTPSRAFDFNTIVSNTTLGTTVTTQGLSNVTVSLRITAGSWDTLNSAPLIIVTGGGGIYHLHSGSVYFTAAPSAALSDMTLNVFGAPSAVYTATTILATVAIKNSIATSQYVPLQINTSSGNNELSLGQNLYVGATADIASWADAEGYVSLSYKQFVPS